MILEAFGLQCLSWFVSPIFSLSVLATVSDALPESTAALVVLCVCQWFWQWCGGRLFGLHVFGGSFSGGIWSSALFSCDFWVANVTSEKVLLYEIPTFWLSGNRQEKARKWSLIFSKLNFTVWTKCCGYFMFFIFELQLWKKLVFYHLLGCCFTIFVASDKFCICLAWNWI